MHLRVRVKPKKYAEVRSLDKAWTGIDRESYDQLFKTIFLNSPTGKYVGQSGKLVLCNPAFEKITGHTKHELSDVEHLSLVVPDDRERVRRDAIRMLKGLRKTPYRFRVCTRRGEVRWVIETVVSILYRGQRAVLGNFIINATGVTITPGIGTVSTTGAQSVTLTATTTYLLTATNDNGTVTASATVTVASAGYPVISSFTASPATVPSGQSTALSWTVTNASTVTIDHSIGTVSASGTRTITPAATTTYTITATNSQGLSTATATVTVTTTSGTPPDITSFTASPTTISAGGSSQLRWQISGATSISIQPYEGEPSSWGYIDVYPTETTTYTLTAFNSSGSDTATVTVTVSP
jgi:PAS domain S-box-containing protein